MALFKKRVFQNKLTKLISENEKVDIEEVLLHEELSPTIRNESEVLYQRILRKEKEPWFYQIIEYALFNKTPPKKYKEYNNFNQINKNASNFLENCGRKFINYFINDKSPTKDAKNKPLLEKNKLLEYLQEIIERFISDENEYNKDPMYAGHFQRFVDNFYRWEVFDFDDTITILTKFLVSKCRILAYQQLITRFISDSKGNYEEVIYSLLTEMLNRSCIAVNYIRKKSHSKRDNALFLSQNLNKEQKINDNNQPLNLNFDPIPSIDFVFTKNVFTQDLKDESEPNIPWKKSVKRTKGNKVKYDNIEDAELEAYLLMMSIRISIMESPQTIDYFRDEDSANKYPLIQSLLYCGTRSPIKSLISLEAFRLLSIIFNGSISLSIQAWNNTEEEKSNLEFYTKYADEMIFDPTALTYKMIHALPVFWNHRYNIEEYKLSKEEKQSVDISDYYSEKTTKKTRKRSAGETALEILQPCLFCEPPISSQLIHSCTDIFIQLSRTRRRLLKTRPVSSENLEKMIQIDGIILDFYQHHFDFGRNYQNTTIPKLAADKVIIPLEPSNKRYYEIKNKRRAALSGFVVDLFLRMKDMRTNPFFQIYNSNNKQATKTDNDQNISSSNCLLTNMGKLDCFTITNITVFYEYQDLTNFELLKESTIYNRAIHNDYCFQLDDDEDGPEDFNANEDDNDRRPNLVLVDEYSKGYNEIMKSEKKTKRHKNKDDDEDNDNTDNNQKRSDSSNSKNKKDQNGNNNGHKGKKK